jgi:P pilus assembly chaperone PapD
LARESIRSIVTLSAAVLAVSVAGLAFAQPAPAPAAAPGADPTASAGLPGAGDVNLAPKRLILSPRERAGQITLFNRGTGPAIYRVSLKDMAMTPAGSLVPADQADPALKAKLNSAGSLLIFSPKRVELAPGQSQVIRIAAKMSEIGTATEYRSNLVVSVEPSASAGFDISQAVTNNPKQLHLQIIPIFGISVPIFVRTSVAPPAAAWTAAALSRTPQGYHLHAELQRKADHSVYGDVEVTCDKAGKPVSLGQMRGIGVYSEIDSRQVDMDLKTPDGVTGLSGSCKLNFTDGEKSQGDVLAQTDVRLP